MNEQQLNEVVRRLQARYGDSSSSPDASVRIALERMVGAGAQRFGVRADDSDNGNFSACDLAPRLARLIDHTALKAETTEGEIRALCDDARRYCFASVCVNPGYVPVAFELLKDSPVAVCTVVGFPLGATTSEVKSRETEQADRKSTRLNSSHVAISYAVFCLKKKNLICVNIEEVESTNGDTIENRKKA